MNAMRAATPAMEFGFPATSPSREHFALPRVLYVNHIPAILMLTGLVTWIASNEAAMVIAAAVGGAVAVYMVWDWLFVEGPTRFTTLVAMGLLLGYGLGTLNTWLTLPRGGFSVAQFLGADEGVYARGMAAVLIASAPLCFLGELFERPVFGSEFRIPLNQRTYLLIVLGTGAMVAGFFTHSLGFQGAQIAGSQLSVASALLSWIFPPLVAVSVAVFMVTRGRFARPLMGFCTVILCFLIMAVSRRFMIYTAMTSIFALRLTGYRLKGTFFKKILLIGGVGFFLAVGITVFMLLRLAGFQTHSTSTSLVQRVQIAMTWVEEGTALSRATEANRTNAQKRTFVLGFFADVLEGSTRRTPAMGQDFTNYLLVAIPRVFYADKGDVLGEEGIADAQFGLTYNDAANSILTNGATDFGIIGVLAYPLLAAAVLRLIIALLPGVLPPLPVAFMALATIFTLVQTETSLEVYLTTIRGILIFAVIFWLFYRLPQFTLRNR